MRNDEAKCRTCPWFFAHEEQPQCRRNPPTVTTIDVVDDEGHIIRVASSSQPVVDPDGWCGVHPDLLPVDDEPEYMGGGFMGGGA